MRAIVAAAVSVMLFAAPASAHVNAGATRVTFGVTVPCAIACAYWVDNGFTPCENPFPPGSYDDRVTAAAPAVPEGKILILEATLDAEIDQDLFLCADNATRLELAQGWSCGNSLSSYSCVPAPCDDPTGIRCYRHEHASTPIRPDQRVIMRAYNWSDPSSATGHYWFTGV